MSAERARKLVTLAADKRTPRKERENAAIAACEMIAKYRLVLASADELRDEALRDGDDPGEDDPPFEGMAGVAEIADLFSRISGDVSVLFQRFSVRTPPARGRRRVPR